MLIINQGVVTKVSGHGFILEQLIIYISMYISFSSQFCDLWILLLPVVLKFTQEEKTVFPEKIGDAKVSVR